MTIREKNPPVERLVTKRQIAAVLAIHTRTVTRLMAAGTIPFIKIGDHSVRFRISEVLKALEDHHEKA